MPRRARSRKLQQSSRGSKNSVLMDTSFIEDSNDSDNSRDRFRLPSPSRWTFRPRSSTGGSTYSSHESDFEDVHTSDSLLVVNQPSGRGRYRRKSSVETLLVNKQSLAEILTPAITKELMKNKMDWSDTLLHKRPGGVRPLVHSGADISQPNLYGKFDDSVIAEEVITPKAEVSADSALTESLCDSTSTLSSCTLTNPPIGRKKIIRRPSLLAAFPSRSRDGRMELVIVNQPEEQHRARYMTEGSRGSIKDRTGSGFPTVKLVGYNQSAVLQVFIGSDMGKVQPHLFYQACKVSGKNCTPSVERRIDGTAIIELNMTPDKDMTVCCDCVGILKERNVDVEQRLPYFSVGRSKKSTRCRMVFRVCIRVGSTSFETLQIASAPILCTQPPGIPEISKKSLTECPATGGKELYIIGKNFLKDTKVIFEEYKSDSVDNEDQEVVWRQVVTPEKEYLHQTHLVCEIPPYRKQNLTGPMKAHLLVESGGKSSEPHPFYFTSDVKIAPNHHHPGLQNQLAQQPFSRGSAGNALGMTGSSSALQIPQPVATTCDPPSVSDLLRHSVGFLEREPQLLSCLPAESSSMLINSVCSDSSSPTLGNCLSAGSPSIDSTSSFDSATLSHGPEGGHITTAVGGDGQPVQLLVMKSTKQSQVPNTTDRSFITPKFRTVNNRVLTRRKSLTQLNTSYFNPQRRFLVRRAVHPYSLYHRHLLQKKLQYQRGRQTSLQTTGIPSTKTVFDPVTHVEQTGFDVVEITDSLNQSTKVLDARTGETLATMVQAGDMQLANVDGETKIVRLTSQDNPGTVSHIEMNDSEKPGGLTLTDVMVAAAGGNDVSVVDVRTTSVNPSLLAQSSQILSNLSPHITQASPGSLNAINNDVNLNLSAAAAQRARSLEVITSESLLENILPSPNANFSPHLGNGVATESSTNLWPTNGILSSTSSPSPSFSTMSPQDPFLPKDVVTCEDTIKSPSIPSMYLPVCSSKPILNSIVDSSPLPAIKVEVPEPQFDDDLFPQTSQLTPTRPSHASSTGIPTTVTDYSQYQHNISNSLTQLSDADLLSMINPSTFDNNVMEDMDIRVFRP